MPRTFEHTSTDPEFRRERARKAGQASHSLDRFVRAIVSRAPELTSDQRTQLRALLADSSGGARTDG